MKNKYKMEKIKNKTLIIFYQHGLVIPDLQDVCFFIRRNLQKN
jgi:hypothetical protein